MEIDFSGTWHNQHASEMDITVHADGTISGKYRTGVGSPTSAEEFALVGFVSDDLIVFSVNFGKYGSMTSWSGQHTKDKAEVERILTMWHLAKNIPNEHEDKKLWAGVWSGCDTFLRGAHPSGMSDVLRAPSHPLK